MLDKFIIVIVLFFFECAWEYWREQSNYKLFAAAALITKENTKTAI